MLGENRCLSYISLTIGYIPKFHCRKWYTDWSGNDDENAACRAKSTKNNYFIKKTIF